MTDVSRESRQEQNGRVETSHHSVADPQRQDKNYYGIPPIKKAHWTWQIPVYFWIGGIAAGVQLFTTLANVLGHKDQALTRTGRYTAPKKWYLVINSPISDPFFLRFLRKEIGELITRYHFNHSLSSSIASAAASATSGFGS